MRYFAAWLYFLGLAAVAVGAIMFVANVPKAPAEEDLVEKSGYLVGIRLERDMNGTDNVYLMLQDDEARYKYQSTYPMYVEVRDRLGIYRDVDLMIDGTVEPGPDNVLEIWGLVEHDPYYEGTVVTFKQIYLETTETDRSWQGIGMYILGTGLFVVLVAFGIRKAVPYKPKDPSA